MSPQDTAQLAFKLGVQIAQVLIPAVAADGTVRTQHTLALGLACGMSYRAIIGNAQVPADEIAGVFAEAFKSGVGIGPMPDEFVRILEAILGPRPWGTPATKGDA